MATAVASSLIFSALPTGPLATVVLYLTEGDLAQLLRTHVEMKSRSSEVASDEFWRVRCCSTFGRHVDCIQGLGKDAFRAFVAAKPKPKPKPKPNLPGKVKGEGKRGSPSQSPGRFNRFRCSDQLLAKCVGASSQDTEYEKPEHTLVPSPCAMMLAQGQGGRWEGELHQSECGCMFWSKCYWSSEPSPIADRDEWLQYDLVDGLAVVSSFVLTPYTSFWQPLQPTYNPIEVCVQLTHPHINGGEKPYYESPPFFVDDSMKRQQFDLPQPILSLGGSAKVVLLGMAQRQTLPESVGETANHYHICISYASLMGTVLLSCRLDDSSVADVDEGNSGGSNEAGAGKGGGGEKKQRGLRLQWVL